MKTICIAILFFCTLCRGSSIEGVTAQEQAEHFLKSFDEQHAYPEVRAKMRIAKFFRNTLFGEFNAATGRYSDGKTSLFVDLFDHTQYASEDGFRFACFADGVVITKVSGDSEGEQVVIWKNEIIGVSLPKKSEVKRSIYKYPWGEVEMGLRYLGVYRNEP